jgi:hypothetical protein
MRTSAVTVALLVWASTHWAPVAAQETSIEGSGFTVAGNWWGGAMVLPDGRFDYCSLTIDYGGTTSLSYILRSDDAFVVIASLDGASFPTGEVIEAIMMGETFGPDTVRARVVNPTTIAIPMPGIAGIAAILRENGRVSIEVGGRQPDIFHTPDAGAAMDAAMACYDRYSAMGAGTQVPAP